MTNTTPVDEDDLDWEEWDGSSPFLHHCIAGSVAGIAEHTLLYPVDTVKTHMQSYCADCPLAATNQAQAAANANLGTNSTSSAAARAVLGEKMSLRNAKPPCMKSGGGGGVTSPITSASAAAGPGTHPTMQPPHPQQHGMWRTMTNLVYYGHPNYHAPLHQFQPRIEHAGASTSAASKHLTTGAMRATADDLVAATGAGAAEVITPRLSRLWRGVQTMVVGCAPAHALYFATYEAVKSMFLVMVVDDDDNTTPGESSAGKHHAHAHLSPIASAAAGAAAAVCHDVIMTPLDTIKQRLQLGHYHGMADAARSIVRYEGYVGLYRSFPITLMTNVPYGMVMVSTNEFLKEYLNPTGQFDVRTYVAAGCGAGMVAAAVTTPLDRVKTRLQTQTMGSALSTMMAAEQCDGVKDAAKCFKARASASDAAKYAGFADAFRSIVREEGVAGLFRGMTPRLLTHTPAVAISWTTYESAKKWLMTNFEQ